MRTHRSDVFIAYRRVEAYAQALQVAEALTDRGIVPYFDRSDLCRGHFEFPLLMRISESANFLLVLTPGALDRCHENGDWLRREIGHAIATSRQLILLVAPGFDFPATLPPDLDVLRRLEALPLTPGHMAEAVSAIVERVHQERRRRQRGLARRYIIAALGALTLIVAAAAATAVLPAGLAIGIKFASRAAGPERPAAVTAGQLTSALAGVRSAADSTVSPVQRLTYELIREDDRARVAYRLPYLDRLRRGEPVGALDVDRGAFGGEVPELTVSVTNNADRAITLATAILKIDSSWIVAEALPAFDEPKPGVLRISNLGWARIELPELRLSVMHGTKGADGTVAETAALSLLTIAESKTVALSDHVSALALDDAPVKLEGVMQYGEPDNRRSASFSMPLRKEPREPGTAVPIQVYNGYFRAGEIAPVVIEMAGALQIEPKASAQFTVHIRTDKTSRNQVRLDFVTTEGTLIHGERFTLELFVSRVQNVQWRRDALRRR